MRGLGAVVFVVLPLVAMTAAWAQGEAAPFHGRVQAAPPVAPLPFMAPRPVPPRIGTFHGVPVRVWAPVEPPYNQLDDRNGAASPLLTGIPSWWVEPPMHVS